MVCFAMTVLPAQVTTYCSGDIEIPLPGNTLQLYSWH